MHSYNYLFNFGLSATAESRSTCGQNQPYGAFTSRVDNAVRLAQHTDPLFATVIGVLLASPPGGDIDQFPDLSYLVLYQPVSEVTA
jgi:hypothetical protein